jgi:hypothetical protein
MAVAGGANRVLDPHRMEGGRFIARLPVILGEIIIRLIFVVFYEVDPANATHFPH